MSPPGVLRHGPPMPLLRYDGALTELEPRPRPSAPAPESCFAPATGISTAARGAASSAELVAVCVASGSVDVLERAAVAIASS
jgi:hypothetical protein